MAERKKVQRIKPKKRSSSKKTVPSGQKITKSNTDNIKMSRESTYSKQNELPKQKKTVSKKENYVKKTNKTLPKNQTSEFSDNAYGNVKRKKDYFFSGEYTPKNTFSVIKGNKPVLQKKRIISVCITLIVLLSVFIFCVTSPTGPIERITNAFSLIGGGELPTTLSGTNVLSFKTSNQKAYALTNSHLCGYTYSGKEFLEIQHGFSNPVLETSKERVLIYNRESNKFIIANNSNTVFEQTVDQTIFCADISDNSSVVFVTASPTYAAQITVYNKNMKQYYTWYLAEGLVSDITLSDNGKYIAVSTLTISGGQFVSKVYCLDTDEKEPIFTKELSDESVLTVESISSACFAYISNKNVTFLNWKSGEKISDSSGFLSPSYFDIQDGYILTTFSEANRFDIVLYNKSGEKKHQLVFNGIIDDISVFDELIYILSGSQIHILDFSGDVKEIINLESKPDYILGVEKGIISINNISVDLVSHSLDRE